MFATRCIIKIFYFTWSLELNFILHVCDHNRKTSIQRTHLCKVVDSSVATIVDFSLFSVMLPNIKERRKKKGIDYLSWNLDRVLDFLVLAYEEARRNHFSRHC